MPDLESTTKSNDLPQTTSNTQDATSTNSLIQKATSLFSSFFYSTSSTTTGPSPQETQEALALRQEQHERCLKRKAKLIQSSPIVRFMLEQLEKAGCPLDVNAHFRCAPCDLSRSGGFSPTHGIILCENRFVSKEHMEDTLTHELIHAFDHCTTTVNWASCAQLACSEIRAVSLSGECRFLKEFKRGHFAIAKQHQVCALASFMQPCSLYFMEKKECVKRRALLGLAAAPHCRGDAGKEALNQVWDKCFSDTAPFDEIY